MAEQCRGYRRLGFRETTKLNFADMDSVVAMELPLPEGRYSGEALRVGRLSRPAGAGVPALSGGLCRRVGRSRLRPDALISECRVVEDDVIGAPGLYLADLDLGDRCGAEARCGK
jgi:hypothetical protein